MDCSWFGWWLGSWFGSWFGSGFGSGEWAMLSVNACEVLRVLA